MASLRGADVFTRSVAMKFPGWSKCTCGRLHWAQSQRRFCSFGSVPVRPCEATVSQAAMGKNDTAQHAGRDAVP